VYVAQGGEHPALFSDELIASNIFMNENIEDRLPMKCYAKIRYRDDDKPCQIISLKNNQCYIKFDKKIKAITKGQSIVLYNKSGLCIGGGIIEKRNIPYLGKVLHE
jgi:tRNA-specific 2-thiouridylase